jgi:hypothetical protein
MQITSQVLQFEKDMASLKAFLRGRCFFDAIRTMKLSHELTPGFRKDGLTPAFHHQVLIAFNFAGIVKSQFTSQLEEDVYDAIFSHDVPEDTKLDSPALLSLGFKPSTVEFSNCLNKHNYDNTAAYYRALSKHIVLATTKGCDRLHNIFSMHGAFTRAKIIAYIAETREDVLPMLKHASHNFPQYADTLDAIRLQLKQQLAIYEHYNRH